MNLADRIKRLRADKGWSQAQLAQHAKVSQQLIGKIEAGKVSESRKIARLADAFGLSVEELLESNVPAGKEVQDVAAAYGDQFATRNEPPLLEQSLDEIWHSLPLEQKRRVIEVGKIAGLITLTAKSGARRKSDPKYAIDAARFLKGPQEGADLRRQRRQKTGGKKHAT